MPQVTWKWFGGQVTKNLEDELGKRVHTCARMIANKMADNISVQGPPASAPGSYPHKASGALISSINITYNDSPPSAAVVVSAEHARHVEKLRPFFFRTLKEMKAKLIRYMTRPLK